MALKCHCQNDKTLEVDGRSNAYSTDINMLQKTKTLHWDIKYSHGYMDDNMFHDI